MPPSQSDSLSSNERNAFEAFGKDLHWFMERNPYNADAYCSESVQMAWYAWRARAAVEPKTGRWYAAEDIDRLVRELDVIINGEAGAAPQAMLCDIVGQLRKQKAHHTTCIGDEFDKWWKNVCRFGDMDERPNLIQEAFEAGAALVRPTQPPSEGRE
jgi:hypothetical protein